MKTGVILARLQPIHNGHIELISKAVDENDEVYVFIGSADKFNARNPLPISLRTQLAQDAIDEVFGKKEYIPKGDGTTETVCKKDKIHIVALDDLTDESDNSHDWGFYLYTKIVTTTKNPCFTIYYSDGYEIITTWFPSFVLRNNVSLALLARGATASGISATKVRQMIEEENEDELKKHVPICVFNNRKTIKQHIELAKLIK